MPATEAKPETRRIRVPAEIINIFGTSGAIFAVAVAGDLLSRLPPPSVWTTAAAYSAPAAAAFAVYWWVSRKL